MANHKSSIKRIRQEEKRRLHNRYYDKLAKVNIIHKNKAANLKSKLAAHIAKIA